MSFVRYLLVGCLYCTAISDTVYLTWKDRTELMLICTCSHSYILYITVINPPCPSLLLFQRLWCWEAPSMRLRSGTRSMMPMCCLSYRRTCPPISCTGWTLLTTRDMSGSSWPGHLTAHLYVDMFIGFFLTLFIHQYIGWEQILFLFCC